MKSIFSALALLICFAVIPIHAQPLQNHAPENEGFDPVPLPVFDHPDCVEYGDEEVKVVVFPSPNPPLGETKENESHSPLFSKEGILLRLVERWLE